MKIPWISLAVIGGVLGAAAVRAEDAAAKPEPKAVEAARPPAAAERPAVAAERMPAPERAMDPELVELRKQMMAVEQSLFSVRQRLGLGGRDRKSIKDEELGKLYDAADAARKAQEVRVVAMLKADAEGGPIIAQFEEIQKKMGELQQQTRELELKMAGVRQRLGFMPAQGETTPPAPADPELAKLRAATEASRKAFDDAMMARIKADPEGAKLLQEREELTAQYKAMRERTTTAEPAAAERKP